MARRKDFLGQFTLSSHTQFVSLVPATPRMEYDGERPGRSALGAAGAQGGPQVPLAADALARSTLPREPPYTLVDAHSSPVPLKLTWWVGGRHTKHAHTAAYLGTALCVPLDP